MKEKPEYMTSMDLADLKSKYNLELLNDDPIIGIYFLIHNGEIIYVGQSKDIHNRITQHRDKSFDDVFFIRYIKDELTIKEEFFVQSLTPLLNKTWN